MTKVPFLTVVCARCGAACYWTVKRERIVERTGRDRLTYTLVNRRDGKDHHCAAAAA